MTRSRASKPASVAITPQRMDFAFENVPRHWFAGDPVVTHFLNALSLTFPDGERFFVDSVRAYRDRITDPVQQKEISGFIGQEAMHSLEHNSFNEMLCAQGYEKEARGGQSLARKLIAAGQARMSKRMQLHATAALEHITAILAYRLLSDPALVNRMDPSVRDLWIWHAIEETEHKGVAFDLLMEVAPDYRDRVRTQLAASLALASYTTQYTWAFLKRDGIHRRPLVLARGLWRLFGINGLVSRTLPMWLRYFRPGFHPWEVDDSHLIAQWRHVLQEEKLASAA